jgi:hypothetical protein
MIALRRIISMAKACVRCCYETHLLCRGTGVGSLSIGHLSVLYAQRRRRNKEVIVVKGLADRFGCVCCCRAAARACLSHFSSIVQSLCVVHPIDTVRLRCCLISGYIPYHGGATASLSTHVLRVLFGGIAPCVVRTASRHVRWTVLVDS